MPPVITTDEAATKLGISPHTLRILCRKRRVPGARKIGRVWFIPDDFSVKPGRKGPKASYR